MRTRGIPLPFDLKGRRFAIAFLASLIAAFTSPSGAGAIENPRQLASFCQKLQKSTKGAGQDIRIPNAREALLCWGYMQAVQDFLMLRDQDGHALFGSCPPEDSRLRDLIGAFLSQTPSRRNEAEANTAIAVIKALQGAYPCRNAVSP
jgi:hypothetical protein